MSARDAMAKAILNTGMNMGALSHRRADTFEGKIVDFQIEALTAAGFSIVHKDEIHAPSVERAIAVAVAQADYFRKLTDNGQGTHGLPGYVRDATWHSWLGSLFEAKHIADALRELMKEVGRG